MRIIFFFFTWRINTNAVVLETMRYARIRVFDLFYKNYEQIKRITFVIKETLINIVRNDKSNYAWNRNVSNFYKSNINF